MRGKTERKRPEADCAPGQVGLLAAIAAAVGAAGCAGTVFAAIAAGGLQLRGLGEGRDGQDENERKHCDGALHRISLTLSCRIQIVPRDGWSQGASFAWDARRGLDPEDAEQDVSLEPGWDGRAGLTNGRTCERAGQGERREQNCDGEHKLGLGRF